MGASVYKTSGHGGAALSLSHVVPAGEVYRLISVTLNLSAAPTTSENFTITLNAAAGPQYDTTLYTLDLAAGSTTDLIWWPDEPTLVWGGDSVDVAWANSDKRTYGCQITVRREA